MKHLLYILFIAALLTGCATPRKATSTDSQQQRDSVRIEYRERTVFVPDTVFVEIPAQTAERTTPDSLSHLENDYAENQSGRLSVSRPENEAADETRPDEQRDSGAGQRPNGLSGQNRQTDYHGDGRGREETELVSENSNCGLLDALGFSNDSLPQENIWNACAAYFEKITNFVPIPRSESMKEGQNPSFFTFLLLFCCYSYNHFP